MYSQFGIKNGEYLYIIHEIKELLDFEGIISIQRLDH